MKLKLPKLTVSNQIKMINTVAVVGVIGTVISTMIDTRRAIKTEQEDDTIFDRVTNTWYQYLPTMSICTCTIFCILHSESLNRQQQLSLIGALIASNKRYVRTKNAIDKTCDDETKAEIRDAIAHYEVPKDKYLQRIGEKCIWEEYSGKFFTCTLDDLLKAEYKLNRLLSTVGYASLNDLYRFIGMEETEEGLYLGWSINESISDCEPVDVMVDFIHSKMVDDDGLEYYYLSFNNQPELNYDMF